MKLFEIQFEFWGSVIFKLIGEITFSGNKGKSFSTNHK